MKDVQSICPACSKRTRLQWHNAELFVTKADAILRLNVLMNPTKFLDGGS